MADYTIRNGRILPYDSRDGVNHPASFWVVDNITIDINSSSIWMLFTGYTSVEKYDLDAEPIAGAQITVSINDKPEFLGMAFSPIGLPSETPRAMFFTEMAWQLAGEKTDFFDSATMPPPRPEPEPEP